MTYLTIRDIMSRTGRTRGCIYQWIAARGFPHAVRFSGTRKLWDAGAVTGWLESNPGRVR